MKEMHGLEVLQRIRSRVATASLPVVVATGSEDPAIEMQLFEAGADDFVVKPVDAPRFLLRIQAVLRRRSANPLAGLS
jgi:DNA-binding response OmpR family regulator